MTNTNYTATRDAGQPKKVGLTPVKQQPTWRVHGSLNVVASDDTDAIGRITRPVLLDVTAPDKSQAELFAFTLAISRYGLDLTYFNVGWSRAPIITCIEGEAGDGEN